MKSEPLEDSEFETLSGILHRFGGKNAMNVEQIDGFLTALTCNPIDISPDQYLPLIWGDEMITEDAFTAQPILQDFLSLVSVTRVRLPAPCGQATCLRRCCWRTRMASIRATIGQTGLCAE
jgi:hypothetical protein